MTKLLAKKFCSNNWSQWVLFWFLVASCLDMTLGKNDNANRQARRILEGTESEGRSFMVYLLKAPESKTNYTDWLCGGTLVKEDFILTSAACVRDVEHLYAMAGTTQYIKDANDTRMTDQCLKCMKKKVIQKFFPDDYEISFEDTVKWSTSDIAVVQVESPYSKCPFKLGGKCAYRPWPIEIDVDGRPYEDNLFTLGWGSNIGYRESGKNEDIDINSRILNEVSVTAVSTKDCKEGWGKKWHNLIDNSMICTLDKYKKVEEKCAVKNQRVEKEIVKEKAVKKITKRHHRRWRENRNEMVHTARDHFMLPKNPLRSKFKYLGFCQNDHGGPLVDIKDNNQYVVIGVASACRISKEMKCIGPYLYTSTYKYRCLILKALNMGTADPCANNPRRLAYDIVVETISWKNHPDGPADNERDEIHTTNK